MAAGSEPRRLPAVLTARRDAGAGYVLVTLTPATELVLAYRTPGQYVRVHAGSGGYFAFAGETGAPSWELLVRNSGTAAEALIMAPEGTSLDVTGPLGEGFPLERAREKPLVIAVVGSALAVARPILRSRIAHREMSMTTVYVGARTAADVPLAGEVAGWARAGARLVLCLSRPELDRARVLPEAERRTGWVQRVLEEDVRTAHVRHGLVFAAGPTAMLAEIRQLAAEATRSDPRVRAGVEVVEDVPMLEVVTNV